jgi:hypothetical protein
MSGFAREASVLENDGKQLIQRERGYPLPTQAWMKGPRAGNAARGFLLSSVSILRSEPKG